MNKYLVSVAEREVLVSTWEVEAKSKEEAETKYYDGHGSLVGRKVTDGNELEIISIKKMPVPDEIRLRGKDIGQPNPYE